MYGCKYDNKIINKADLIKTFILKTAIIENECSINLNNGILDGPKYLLPLMQFILPSFLILCFKVLAKQ